MEIDKRNLKTDALGYLYRAAFFMAKNQPQSSLVSLSKAKSIYADNMSVVSLFNKLNERVGRSVGAAEGENVHWAEKILDLYISCKRELFLASK